MFWPGWVARSKVTLSSVAMGELDHDDGVGSGGDRGAGHDLNAGARGSVAAETVSPGFDLADAAE